MHMKWSQRARITVTPSDIGRLQVAPIDHKTSRLQIQNKSWQYDQEADVFTANPPVTGRSVTHAVFAPNREMLIGIDSARDHWYVGRRRFKAKASSTAFSKIALTKNTLHIIGDVRGANPHSKVQIFEDPPRVTASKGDACPFRPNLMNPAVCASDDGSRLYIAGGRIKLSRSGLGGIVSDAFMYCRSGDVEKYHQLGNMPMAATGGSLLIVHDKVSKPGGGGPRKSFLCYFGGQYEKQFAGGIMYLELNEDGLPGIERGWKCISTSVSLGVYVAAFKCSNCIHTKRCVDRLTARWSRYLVSVAVNSIIEKFLFYTDIHIMDSNKHVSIRQSEFVKAL